MTVHLFPAGPWCQRWTTHRTPSWRHIREGEFDQRRYDVDEVAEPRARRFVEQLHYSGSFPAAIHRVGMFERGTRRLVGVAVFGAPVSARTLTNAFPTLTPYQEAVELSRFVLVDDVPANGESWFLARARRIVRDHGVRGVVSFADPQPRTTQAGQVVLPGHVGHIYTASNATYTGRGTPRRITLMADGSVLNARSMQKVRRQEQGHRYVEERLVAAGADPYTGREAPGEWQKVALTAAGARSVRHAGNHRFLFRLGSPRDRAGIPLGFAPVGAHPQTPDAAPA